MMDFEQKLHPDETAVLQMLGGAPPGAQEAKQLARAMADMAEAARPRWTWRCLGLDWPPALREAGPVLREAALSLPGRDIAAHLAGCGGCILLAVTLGQPAEQLVRTAEAADMARAVMLDAAGSALVEQYTDLAEDDLRRQASDKALYLTSRFSPGYGDLPLALQSNVLRLLNAQRAIGLTVSDSGIMLPRKSITALLGLSSKPVTGHLAGCANCTIKSRCQLHQEGKYCGKSDL
ncbi:MAG: methionine synthase [Ruminococcaceae bacterium]|nr:methionine synthase [Oscillospiraceae bacterium]